MILLLEIFRCPLCPGPPVTSAGGFKRHPLDHYGVFWPKQLRISVAALRDTQTLKQIALTSNPPTLSGVLDPSGRFTFPLPPSSLGPGPAKIKNQQKTSGFIRFSSPDPQKPHSPRGCPLGGLERSVEKTHAKINQNRRLSNKLLFRLEFSRV